MRDPHLEDRHRELWTRADALGERHLRAVGRAEEDPEGRAAEVAALLAGAGLLQAVVPPRFGTADARGVLVLRERLAYFSLLAESVLAAHGLAAHLVAAGGAEPLRARWLPALAAGTALGAVAVSEPEAGSDLGAIRTTARAEGSLWRLEGEKTWVTAPPAARVIVLLARSSAGEGTRGLSLFIVDGEAVGLARRPVAVAAALPVWDLRLDGAHGALVGREGEGAAALEAAYDRFRPGAAGAACGLAERARDETVRHALARRQFGRTLASFQATRLAIADTAAEIAAAQRLARHAAWLADEGAPEAPAQAAAARVVAADAACRAVDRAVQAHGASGLVRGSTVERLAREARALRLREGTNEMLRLHLADSILKESR
jgi:acyl-CoA dehydrogenase